MSDKINDLLNYAIKANASDLHLSVGSIPMVRIDGKIQTLQLSRLKNEDMINIRNQVLNDNQKKILSNSIINLANNLNLDIVTEGIENKNELDFFTSKKCSKFQGYFFSKPLPKKDFEKLILSS